MPLITRRIRVKYEPAKTFKKSARTAAGGLTAAGLIGLVAIFGVELDPEAAATAVAIIGLAAGIFHALFDYSKHG